MNVSLPRCSSRCEGLRPLSTYSAWAMSPAVPCAITRKPSAAMAVSYCSTLSRGMPMLASAAPSALRPPTIAAPSMADTAAAAT